MTVSLLSNTLTTSELAAELRRATKTLVRWRRLRVGPPWLRVQGRVLYDRAQVQQWLLAQSVTGDKR